MKTTFKRFVSFTLSFAFLFLMLGDMSFQLNVSASENNNMHVIVKHWHANGDSDTIDYTVDGSNIIKDSPVKFSEDSIAADESTLKTHANPDETFSGFAVSAGNDCVTLHSSEEPPYFTVKYNSDVHLVKVHVFYSAKPKLVPGTEMTVGTEGGIDSEYEDTKTQLWSTLDTSLQGRITDAIGDDRLNELLTGDGISDQYIKLYNTSEGLHTDKTATPVYNNDLNNAGTSENDEKGTGTRVFDINLEAWYNDQATAKVGLILDASGSMAFISSDLEPMHFRLDEGKGYNLGDGTNLNVPANQYLTPEEVNRLLNTNLTDNSKLSYSDYSYYIFDTRDFTQEFVPLAYWDGDNHELEPGEMTLEGVDKGYLFHWDIENDNRNKEYYVVKKDSSGVYQVENDYNPNRKTTTRGATTDKENKAIQLISYFNDKNGSGHDGYYMALNDEKLPTDNSFTVTFAVQCKNSGYGPLLSIGPKTATKSSEGYLFTVDKSNHLLVKNKNGDTIAQICNAFNNSINTSGEGGEGYNYFTFVFESGKLYSYLNGELIADKKTNPNDYKSMVYNNNSQGKPYTSLDAYGSVRLQAVIGGFWSDEEHYSTDTKRTLNLDDIVIYDSALSVAQVEQMYKVLAGESSTAVSSNIKAYDGENVIATYKEALNKGKQTDRAGWYFVNSGSNLDNFYSEDIGTAKELCGLLPDEVIKNEIVLEDLPQSVQDYFVEKKDEVATGNGGYIATSGTDFTGKGYLWDGDGKASAKERNVGTDEGYDPAITVPGGETRQYISGYSPCVFFIDKAGYLRCFYNNGGNTHTYDSEKDTHKYTDELRSGVSYVYQKSDDKNIKTEDLQYALGQFTAQLHNATPNSMISAVRFSNQKVTKNSKGAYADGKPSGIKTEEGNVELDTSTKDCYEELLKKLVMLDWTSDTKEISQILSLERKDGGSNDHVTSTTNDNEELVPAATALEQYNYGMTGGTYTWTGFQAYTDYLDTRIKGDDQSKKYIILFTDGMDNMLDKGETEQNYAINLAKYLKGKGYTIFCVVLKNDSFDTGADSSGKLNRGERVQQYMAKIAGNSETDKKTYSPDDPTKEYEEKYNALQKHYIFEAENVDDLTAAFTGEILRQISSSLLDYSVQDYIDPRFDLVDRTGKTYVLGNGGTVTVKNEAGEVTGSETLTESTGKTITINDGSEATLKYDPDEKMYYLEWLKQDIPGTTPGQNSLTIWSRTFRIKAKEDFIGGNGILTNGNDVNQNWVFSPNDTVKKSSGVDDAKVDKKNVDSDDELIDPYVSKGFPRTVVNVRELLPTVKGGNDVIYLGETIDPHDVAEKILRSITYNECTNNEYWQYLARYYINNPLEKIGTPYSDFDKAFPAAIDDILEDDDLSITLPYIYLSNTGIPEVTPNNTGSDDYKKDIIGFIKYSLEQFDPANDYTTPMTKDDIELKKFSTHDDTERQYAMTVTYYPLSVDGTGAWTEDKDGNAPPALDVAKDLVGLDTYNQNRKTYLNDTVGTNGKLIKDTDYSWDIDYKPAAGEEQKAVSEEGKYTIDIVKGEVVFGVTIDSDVYDYYQKHFAADGTGFEVTYNAELNRFYNDPKDKGSTAADSGDQVGEYEIKFTIKDSWKDFVDSFDSNTDYHIQKEPDSTGGTAKIGIYKAIALDENHFNTAGTDNKFKTSLPIGQYTFSEGTVTSEPPVKFGDIKFRKLTKDDEEMFTLLDPKAGTKLTEDYSVGSAAISTIAGGTKPDHDNIGAEIGSDNTEAYLGYPTDGTDAEENPPIGGSRIYTDHRLALASAPLEIDTGTIEITKEVASSDGRDIETAQEFTFILTPYLETTSGQKPVTLDTDDVVIDGEAATSAQFYPSTDSDGSYILKLKQNEKAKITLPKNAKCTVEEKPAAGYKAYTNYADKTELSLGGETVNTGKTLTVTNEKQVKSISISKTVTVNGGSDIAPEDENTLFEFEIELSSGTSGADVNGSYDAVIGSKGDTPAYNSDANVTLTFEGGKLTNVAPKDPAYADTYANRSGTVLKLKHDEKITIFGIPEDAIVKKVYESDSKGYTSSDESDGTTGEIKFTNDRKTFYLTISKKVESVGGEALTTDDTNKGFKFVLVLDKGTAAAELKGSYECTIENGGDPTSVTINVGTDGKCTVDGAADDFITLKDGDVLTISGLPENTSFTVYEDKTDIGGYEPSVTLNGAPQLSENSVESTLTADSSVVFTNTRKPLSLEITKKVEVSADYEGSKDPAATFTINVELKNSDGDHLTGSYYYKIKDSGAAYPEGDGTLQKVSNDGTMIFEGIKDGQTIMILGLPEGTKYTVSEEDRDDYIEEISSAADTVLDSKSGSVVTVTNTMQLGQLEVTKKISPEAALNDFDEGMEFAFTVQFKKDGKPLTGTYPVTIDGGEKNTKIDDGTWTFKLKHGESAVIKGLPRGTTYTITETETAIAGYTPDANNIKGTISSGDPDEEYCSVPVTVTNNKKTAALSVTKVVYEDSGVQVDATSEDYSLNDEFEVKLQVYIDTDGKDGYTEDSDIPVTGTYSGHIFDDDGNTTFTITNGETVTIEGLPEGAKYIVNETADVGYTTGYGYSDLNRTITADPETKVTINNTKKTDNVSITKEVVGYTGPAKSFKFDIKATKGGKPVQGKFVIELNGKEDEIELDNDGAGTFTLSDNGKITIKGLPVGTEITVVEDEESAAGFAVSVNGTAAADRKYSASIENDGDELEAVFTNSYNIADISISKTVYDYNEAEDNEAFTFEISADGNTDFAGTYKVEYETSGVPVDTSSQATEVTFTGGIANITLYHGQTVTIKGVPADMTFTVSEIKIPDKYEQVTDNKVIYTKAGDTHLVEFTNKKKSAGTLIVTKEVAEADGTEGEFNISVTFSGTEDLSGIKLDGAEIKGTTVTVTLGNNDEAKFTDIPYGTSFHVEETTESSKGYTVTYSEASEIADDGDGKISADTPDVIVTVTNTKKPTASLTVTKTVTGEGADTSQEFDFTVTIVPQETGTDMTLSVDDTAATVSGGTVKFKLAHEQSVTISGIPSGATYTVAEDSTYAADYSVEYKDSATGTISADAQDVTVNVINTKKAAEPSTASLTVTKTVTGEGADTSQEFDFTVTIVPQETVTDMTLSVSGDYTAATVDGGTVKFKLAHEQSVTISGIPSGATYTVEEDSTYAADYSVEYKDSATGTISADAQDVTVNVINTKKAAEPSTASLTVTKTVTGEGADTSLAFDFTATIIPPSTVTDMTLSVSGDYTAATIDGGTVKFKLAHEQNITISGIPSGATYTVAEDSAYAADYSVEYKDSATGTISADAQDVTVNVINTKKTAEPSPGTTASLTVTKAVTGEGADTSLAFDFTATIIPPSTVTDMTLSVSGDYTAATIDGGTVTFKLAHGQSVTISGIPSGATYTVAEDSTYAADYSVEYNSSATGTISADAQDVTVNVINTKKAAEPSTASLTVTKAVAGEGADTSLAFDFTATIIPPSTVTDMTLSVSGDYTAATIDGGTVTFKLAHGQSVTISGIPSGSTYNVSETSAVTGYTASFKGVPSGTILTNTEVDYTNTFGSSTDPDDPTPPPVDPPEKEEDPPKPVDLIIHKDVVDENGNNINSENNDSFEFVIEIFDMSGNYASGPFDYTGTKGSSGSISSGGRLTLKAGETVTIKEIPAGYVYKIMEITPESGEYKVNGSDTMSSSLVDHRANTVYFENRYTPKDDPNDPGNPGNPGNPSNPGNPGNPSNPGNPNDPSDPGDPNGGEDPYDPDVPYDTVDSGASASSEEEELPDDENDEYPDDAEEAQEPEETEADDTDGDGDIPYEPEENENPETGDSLTAIMFALAASAVAAICARKKK